MESRLFINIGCWKHFDDLEDNLILDELILLNDAIFKRDKEKLKIDAIVHGFPAPEDDEEEEMSDEPLDPRILEMERKYHETHTEGPNESHEFAGFGLGFSTN